MLIHRERAVKDKSTIVQPLLQHFMRIEGMIFQLFPPRRLTISSNKSMMIDQASKTTL